MTELWDFIYYPLTLPFIQRAILAAMATGIVCALLSCFLVLKGWSLMGDAISHAVLPGIVLAYLAGIPIIIGAFVSGLCCSVATGYIKEHSRIKEDTVMGIVFSGMFAFGLVLFSKVDTSQHLNHILFGSVLGTSYDELKQIILIAATVSILIIIKRRDLMLYCFDAIQAQVIGLPVRLLHYGLLSVLALTIVGSLKAAGVILVIAMLISPGITAFLLTKRFDMMLIIAVIVSVFSTLTGTLISYYSDASTSACIVILQAIIFVIAQVYQYVVYKRTQN
ncbi:MULTISPECIES: metal ABC transporter permease [unclassified Gilliamella]|uniref:metal ABC transporter permease n=1 Tax=unclassified Gilliamella TaxID=2685620 RepID=UPI00226AD603|nr:MULTISPECIES: metal ABC transporter permease [unclassified Gilliamella]MCX8641990.1 metal ABC transporter permease [Gilliamella sp. B3835]MCX8706883.1 metal ABC transporter permease [Gilliamella sp. B3783]MCX8708739.1 metal ABC transporter permease [Gilliamella sp. B3780]MCX8713434.1 metal ABC transporter permease [Gilliamella sp. B3781]MCX8715513.1 metal ABC transporter permease [Gilliamella sp. B3784]